MILILISDQLFSRFNSSGRRPTTTTRDSSEITSISHCVTRTPYALGVFPTAASLLNHSCDPNSATVVLKGAPEQSEGGVGARRRGGSVQVTFATRLIRKGEEICHVYQGHFGDTGLAARRAVLRNMFRELGSMFDGDGTRVLRRARIT